ncbi:hypothetical protein PPL_00442 [Heterostelium album PN500]|uniref:Uncharacterized protein n=1 Tax=Heterostelium pallidum (strain ATCC 26659 / Pp 5 / PN500) TaxID=670386 RepID=D3AWG8_HETP5|nr:hypothetical protein PPL_00442 [Heterostelium album PN500]EFA86641.1 hypothetical protein PPL_00442 [Heterostelium album PN500]|eukprot:XP_020438746.1 hypothetical protein PPL_00442 [Heterostelium album PN500]
MISNNNQFCTMHGETIEYLCFDCKQTVCHKDVAPYQLHNKHNHKHIKFIIDDIASVEGVALDGAEHNEIKSRMESLDSLLQYEASKYKELESTREQMHDYLQAEEKSITQSLVGNIGQVECEFEKNTNQLRELLYIVNSLNQQKSTTNNNNNIKNNNNNNSSSGKELVKLYLEANSFNQFKNSIRGDAVGHIKFDNTQKENSTLRLLEQFYKSHPESPKLETKTQQYEFNSSLQNQQQFIKLISVLYSLKQTASQPSNVGSPLNKSPRSAVSVSSVTVTPISSLNSTPITTSPRSNTTSPTLKPVSVNQFTVPSIPNNTISPRANIATSPRTNIATSPRTNNTTANISSPPNINVSSTSTASVITTTKPTATTTTTTTTSTTNSFISKASVVKKDDSKPSWISISQQKSMNNANVSSSVINLPTTTSNTNTNASSTTSSATATTSKVYSKSTLEVGTNSTSSNSNPTISSTATTSSNIKSIYTPKLLEPVEPSTQLSSTTNKTSTTTSVSNSSTSPPYKSNSFMVTPKTTTTYVSPPLTKQHEQSTSSPATPVTSPPVTSTTISTTSSSAPTTSSFLLNKQQFENKSTNNNNNVDTPKITSSTAIQPKTYSSFLNKTTTTTTSTSSTQPKSATPLETKATSNTSNSILKPTSTPLTTTTLTPTTSLTSTTTSINGSCTATDGRKGGSVLEISKQFAKPIGISHSYIAAPTTTNPVAVPTTNKSTSSFIPQAQTTTTTNGETNSNGSGSKLFLAKQQLESINIVDNIKKNIQIKSSNPFSSLTPQKQEQLNLRRQQLLQQKDL